MTERPAGVDTPGDLVKALRDLLARAGFSYRELQMRAERLPPARGRAPNLSRSTIGDLLKDGGRLPRRETLVTFLTVCGVSDRHLPAWLAAWERAATAGLARPAGALRIRDADPRSLGVHAAIEVPGGAGGLPGYVPRDADAPLRAALAPGCFVLLVGGSSVGKTRMLYEAVLAVLPDHWLVQPHDVAAVTALAEAPAPRTVVWLDDLQYLLGDGRELPAAVRILTQAGTFVVGTIWPGEFMGRTAPPPPTAPDPHPGDRELLRTATVIDVAAELTPTERARAEAMAAGDARVRVALATADHGFTQVLAAGPALVRRWEQATDPYGRAVLTAALDARRLGVQAPLSRAVLADAVPGYLSSADRATAPTDWLERALGYATTRLQGAAAALEPVDAGMGVTAGYRTADYLHQYAERVRRRAALPASLWSALVDHADRSDRYRLMWAARQRLQLGFAEAFGRRGVAAGEHDLVSPLVTLLIRQGRRAEVPDLVRAADDVELAVEHLPPDEALAWLREHAAAGDDRAGHRLGERLGADGAVAEAIEVYRPLAARGDSFARLRLTELFAGADRLTELAELADIDTHYAPPRLAGLHAAAGRVDLLRERNDRGDTHAARELGMLLARQGRPAEAVTVLLPWAAAGEAWVGYTVARDVAAAGDLDAALDLLRAHVDAGFAEAALPLADLLRPPGRVAEALPALRAWAATGAEWAVESLATILAEVGRADEAVAVLRPAAGGGSVRVVHQLVSLLIAADRRREAIEVLRGRFEAGDTSLVYQLAGQLREDGQRDESNRVYRLVADSGDRGVADHLARVLEREGALDELRAEAAVRPAAVPWLVTLLERQGRVDELLDRAAAGDPIAARVAARALLTRARADEAVAVLRQAGDGAETVRALVRLLVQLDRADEALSELVRHGLLLTDDDWAALADRLVAQGHGDAAVSYLEALGEPAVDNLLDLLVRLDRTDAVRDLADRGHFGAATAVVEMARSRGDLGVLLAEVHAGTLGAAAALVDTLRAAGDTRAVTLIERVGLNPDGTMPS